VIDIQRATHEYEAWLGEQLTLIPQDLRRKHAQMADALFPFLRATFYRWAQQWPHVCAELAAAPVVVAVGDLHVENFGTWRDSDGRLVWGINDFDEAYPLAYTNDLVRLATSAHLAIAAGHLAVASQEACDAILTGYAEGLQQGGRPFVLAERHQGLRIEATGSLRDPVVFWAKIEQLPSARGKLPLSATRILERLLPEAGLRYRVVHRIAGLGSLGRERWAAIAEWRGGLIAREVKAIAPSTWVWANLRKSKREIFYQTAVDRAVRAPDPHLQLTKRWVARRLAPDSSRIELSDLPKERDEARLLHAMGWETANVHLGSRRAVKAIGRDLAGRKRHWLHAAAGAMADVLTKDWAAWKQNPAP
jgi:uncharacterized protein (DUF2252 family)